MFRGFLPQAISGSWSARTRDYRTRSLNTWPVDFRLSQLICQATARPWVLIRNSHSANLAIPTVSLLNSNSYWTIQDYDKK